MKNEDSSVVVSWPGFPMPTQAELDRCEWERDPDENDTVSWNFGPRIRGIIRRWFGWIQFTGNQDRPWMWSVCVGENDIGGVCEDMISAVNAVEKQLGIANVAEGLKAAPNLAELIGQLDSVVIRKRIDDIDRERKALLVFLRAALRKDRS